ncbi:hypothetical protein, partial [Actinacidiphila rubida]
MRIRRATAAAATAAALAPALLLAAGPARADTAPDPSDPTTLPSCADVSTAYGDYEQNSLRADVQGVPKVVVAGDGWHEATGTLHNIGGTTLPVVVAFGSAWRETDGDGDPALGPYATVQVQDAGGAWTTLSGGSSGRADVLHDLAPGATRTYHLRFEISADVPKLARDGELSFEGLFADRYTYRDTGKTVDCAGDSSGMEGYVIEQAGSTTSPTATPTASPTHSPTAAPTVSTTGSTPSG